jgi:hypothetical protein
MTRIKRTTTDTAVPQPATRTLCAGCGAALVVIPIGTGTVLARHPAMSRSLTLCFTFLLVPAALSAGNYRTGVVYGALGNVKVDDHGCGDRVYDPEVFALPNGDLRLLAQGNNDSLTDYFFAFTRNAADGSWSLPTSSVPRLAPALQGMYSRCAYSSHTNPPGPIASPSVVHVGDRYYMAYVGGNADGITGKVYWAMSHDGLSWNLYDWGALPGQDLTPIVNPIYHEECSGLDGDSPSGAEQVSLSVEDDYFYVHIRYGHYAHGHYRGTEALAFRFSYNVNHPFGIGPIHEIWQNGRWVADSGRLVWNYDNAASYPGDPVLTEGAGMTMHTGAGDVKFDPRLNAWVHFSQSDAGEPIEWEYATSLAAGHWTYGGVVDTSTMNGPAGAYRGKTLYYPGIYNGPLCNGCPAGSYVVIPVDTIGCDFGFSGLEIVPVELIYTP